MGCLGYICKGCKTSIRGNCWDGGEKAVLIHVRHGEELGRVEGHYDEYGRVIEQKDLPEDDRFRGQSDSINGHKEICSSELSMEDSYCKVKEKRVFNEKEYSYYLYLSEIINDEEILHWDDLRNSKLYEFIDSEYKNKIEEEIENKGETNTPKIHAYFHIGLGELEYDVEKEMYKDFMGLPQATREEYSGIVAWHYLCYNKATEEERVDLTPSEFDKYQSWGKVRKKYI